MLTPHKNQTQAQFNEVILGNVVNITSANWPKTQAPAPLMVSATHRKEGISPQARHFVEFTYADGSVKSFDGNGWTDIKKAQVN